MFRLFVFEMYAYFLWKQPCETSGHLLRTCVGLPVAVDHRHHDPQRDHRGHRHPYNAGPHERRPPVAIGVIRKAKKKLVVSS